MITDEPETRLREALTRAAADIEVPAQARQRLLSRDYHPQTVNRKLTAVLAAAAAVAIIVPLAIGGGSHRAAGGPVLRLASYTFQLPAGYKLTAATVAPCHVSVAAVLPWDPNANDRRGPPGQPAMQAAASASGGCIAVVLAPPYTPTAAVPDPEAPVAGAHPVQVGRYHGVIVHSLTHYPPVLVFSVAGIRAAKHHLFTELFVPLPVGGGEMRDLVIGASQLSESELIKIAAAGLAA
jgi:hypothetical protein